MASNCKNNIQYVPYKEIIKQRSREYYNKNKEIIKEKNKIQDDSSRRNVKNIEKNGIKIYGLKNNNN